MSKSSCFQNSNFNCLKDRVFKAQISTVQNFEVSKLKSVSRSSRFQSSNYCSKARDFKVQNKIVQKVQFFKNQIIDKKTRVFKVHIVVQKLEWLCKSLRFQSSKPNWLLEISKLKPLFRSLKSFKAQIFTV